MKLYLVSERESSAWEDCVWCSGVMVANVLVGENRYPATRAEYEGLRYAGTGEREVEGDGSNYRELERGIAERYGITGLRRGSGWRALLAACPVGDYAAVQGWTGALPARLQRSGPIGHSFVVHRVAKTQFDLYDPLARNGDAPTRISVDELRRYYEALSGAEWIAARVGEAWRDPVIRMNLERWILRGTTARPIPVYEQASDARPPATQFRVAVEVTAVGVPLDRADPDGVNYSWRAIMVRTSAIDGVSNWKIGFVKREHCEPVETSPEWDAAAMKALLDPTFRGGETIDATEAQISAAKLAGLKQGLERADAAIERVKVAAGVG